MLGLTETELLRDAETLIDLSIFSLTAFIDFVETFLVLVGDNGTIIIGFSVNAVFVNLTSFGFDGAVNLN